MKFESYIKILFYKYLWKKINFKEYDSVFEKYNIGRRNEIILSREISKSFLYSLILISSFFSESIE